MSPLGLYGALVALLLASAMIGWGLLAGAGRREWTWFAPALGLATLVVIGFSALPGRGVTVSALTVTAIAAAAFALVRLGPNPRPAASAALPTALPVVLAVVLAASIPFAAGGGFDIMGTYVNNDLAFHLNNAEWLRSHEGMEPQQIADGYPIGPHGLVVALSTLTGTGLPEAWNALLIATAVATALASLSVIGGLRPAMRTLGALLVGLSYLGASFYVQSAFKETLMALFALGFALALRQLAGEGRAPGSSEPPGEQHASVSALDPTTRDRGGGALPGARPTATRLMVAAMAPTVFALACVATYSVPGLGWPLGTLAIWAAVSLLPSRLPAARAALTRRPWLLPVGVAALAAAVLLALVAWDRAADFIGGREVIGPDALANLFDPIPPYETLGLWLSSDYRIVDVSFLGHGGVYTWLLVGLGLLAAGFGTLRLVNWRELSLISALLAGAVFWAVSSVSLGPYVASKALAVAAPLVMLTAVVGIAPHQQGRDSGLPLARAVLAVAFAGIALGSSYLALSGARLDRDDHAAQLAQFRNEVAGDRVLFLGSDELAFWALRGASVVPGTQTIDVPLLPRTGERVDLDDFQPELLDVVDFAIATNSSYASESPSNFQPVDRTESFTLYERIGPAPPRQTLPEGELPGGILDCDDPVEGQLRHQQGIAHVFERTPVLAPFGDSYGSGPAGGSYPEWVQEGQAVARTLSLAPGRWEISLQYHSLEPVVVDAPGLLHVELPPNSSRIGPYWPVGTIKLDERAEVTVTVQPQTRSGLRGLLDIERGRTGPETILGVLVASPPDQRRDAVPLSKACDQLVDWYELEQPAE